MPRNGKKDRKPLNDRNAPRADDAPPASHAPDAALPPAAPDAGPAPSPKIAKPCPPERKARILHARRYAHAAPVPGAGDVPFDPHEFVFDAPPPPRLATINVRLEDKSVFDALQGLVRFHKGRGVTQWELFTIVLADALGNPEGAAVETGLSG